MIKNCKYECGTELTWSDSVKFWVNAKNGELHDYKKCAEIQKSKGQKPFFFDKVKTKNV